MTLPMDIRLVAEGAKIGFVFARRGIVPEACSSWFLPRIVGISQAMEWVATGRVFSADEALAGGLVRSVHAPGELLGAAHALASEIAENTAAGVGGAGAPVAVDACSAPSTRWRPTVPTPARCSRAGSQAMRRRASRRFSKSVPPEFPDRVSDGLPDLFPGRADPTYS